MTSRKSTGREHAGRKLRRALTAAAAALAGALAVPAAGQDVEAGVRAWQQERYDEAVAQWRPLADRGDADAQFNLGHAYRLGRGVPRNMNLAEQWYERAARAGHVEAQAMYGLILFQNGRRSEALPFIAEAAAHGDARAQYVYGTALFNGDLVERDWPRAFALMTRAAAEGLPYAQSQLREMEQHLSPEDRARGAELAQAMAGAAPTRVASAAPPLRTPSVPPRPPRVAGTQLPPSAVAQPPRRETRQAPSASAPAPTPGLASPGGRWRVQLGAFSSEANARRAWGQVSSRLPGLEPRYERAGAVVRLQAGPLGSRASADRACAAARQACFPVAP